MPSIYYWCALIKSCYLYNDVYNIQNKYCHIFIFLSKIGYKIMQESNYLKCSPFKYSRQFVTTESLKPYAQIF